MSWPVALGVGLVVGALVGWVVARRRGRVVIRSGPSPGPVAAAGGLIPELIVRANRAAHLCVVSESEGVAHWGGERLLAADERDRLESVARLAASDGRRHVVRNEALGCLVGVGVGEGQAGVGAALLVPSPAAGDDVVNRVAGDLKRFLEGESGPAPSPADPEPYRPAVDSVAGIAHDLCERARQRSGHPSLVVRRSGEGAPVVVAGSVGSDRRLLGTPVDPESLAARACTADQMLAASAGDLLGRGGRDRRRMDNGIAIPLRDGNEGIGALVVLAPPGSLSDRDREELLRLAARVAPSFAAASAVKTAEDRAVTDPLTGLPNRTALARAMHAWGAGPCSLLGVDIDHFKTLNDTHGHPAGDAALQRVADVFRRALRDHDLPARVGGEEFALWLPGVSRAGALEVAERVREMVEALDWRVGGKRVPITCSIGVASVPETTGSPDNLVTAADAALYRAKERGRNRVEVAGP